MIIIIKKLLIFSLFIVKLSQGLNLTIEDLNYFKNKPLLLKRSLLAVDVFVPIAAYLIVTLLQLPIAISTAILLAAACPGSPLTIRKIYRKGGILSYGASLHLTVVLASIFTTPITLWFLFCQSNLKINIHIIDIIKQLTFAQFIPLVIGLFINSKFNNIANKIRNPLTVIGASILLIVSLVILIVNFKFILQINLLSLIAIAFAISIYLAIGYFMGGVDPQQRHTLALICASRNTSLAAFIAGLNFPVNLVLPNLIPYLFVSTLVEIVYLRLFKSKLA